MRGSEFWESVGGAGRLPPGIPPDPDFRISLENVLEEYATRYSLNLDEYFRKFMIRVGDVLRRIEVAGGRLPKFRVVSSPSSSRWQERLAEEFEVFRIFRDLQISSVGYAAFDNLEQVGSRRFKCTFVNFEGRPDVFVIRLPVDYPRRMPSSKYTDGLCRGKYEKIWKRNGSWGISHYLTNIAAPIMSHRGIY